MTKEFYKDISYINHKEHSLFEIILGENNIDSSAVFIEKISVFVELICLKKPLFVLFNKRDEDFKINKAIYNFTHNQILDSIFKSGVRAVFFLVTDERYELYKNSINRENVFAFKFYEDIFNFIENKK